MKTINARNRRGGGITHSYLLAAMGGTRVVASALVALLAFAATQSAQAADRNWTGGQTGVANTEASPYNIWNTSNWSGSGDLGAGNKLILSVSEKTYINSGSGNQIGGDFLLKVFIGAGNQAKIEFNLSVAA